MRVHSIFLHLMRSLSECPLWSTLRVRPSHRVFYPWGVRQKGGMLHIGMQREGRVLLQGTRLVRQNADGIQRCAAACTAWCGHRGMRPPCMGLNWSCGISKPTTCLMLESLPTTRVQRSAIRPLCTGYMGPAGRSKPTQCCKRESLQPCVISNPAIRPCGSWFPPGP